MLSEAMNEEVGRGTTAVVAVKACHLPEPAAVAEAAQAAEPEADVEVAADAADNRSGTAQPLLNGGNIYGAANQS